MTFQSLRDFIEKLESSGDLIRIKEPVSLHLEMTEIHKRVLHKAGPALLFENALKQDGTPAGMPVLTNLFGTKKRVAWGMGVEEHQLRDVGNTIAFLKQPEPPTSLKEALGFLPLAKTLLSMKPKTVKKAPCQEIVLKGDQIDLTSLPIQGCWPNEPAPLMTWPMVVTKGPSTSAEDNFNLGIYRMQLLSPQKMIMRWLKHRGGAQHHQRWKEARPKEPLPCALVLGADPATLLAAVTPVPETLSEYHFAGLLRKKGVELVDCKTIPLKVPAHAEIVIEGHVSLDEYAPEGPYGDHTGYYNAVEDFPVFTATAITMRKDPIYLTTYTGRPPDEPAILGEALNEVLIPLLIQQFPEIVDFYLPPEGCSYRVGIVSIKKAYPGHAKRIMMGIWSFLRQFMYTKWIIVVDEDINIRHWPDVIWAISTRMDPVRDITLIDHTPIDYLDFASPQSGLGSKIGLDATNKLPPETHREWGEVLKMDQATIDLVDQKWKAYGIE